jgi:hypothetical protein
MHRLSCRHGATAMRRVVNANQRFKSTRNTTTDTTATTTTTAPQKEDMTIKIGGSIVAVVLGVATVTAVAGGVESSTASSCPPYSAGGQRFSQAEFSGRFCRMLMACDPRLLFYSDEQVQKAKKLLDGASQYSQDRTMDRTLWEARRVVEAALHPDTGETIPRPFRMSGFVPFNGPIGVSMIVSTSTMPLLFWAWINQSQNALVNYYVSLYKYNCMNGVFHAHILFLFPRVETSLSTFHLFAFCFRFSVAEICFVGGSLVGTDSIFLLLVDDRLILMLTYMLLFSMIESKCFVTHDE